MRHQLTQTLSRLSVQHPEWAMHSLTPLPQSEPEHCAEFWMDNSTKVWVSLLEQIQSTDVIRQGLVVHGAMQKRALTMQNTRCINIVVIPGLTVKRPVLLSSLVVISSPSVDVLAAGLSRIAEEARLHSSAQRH